MGIGLHSYGDQEVPIVCHLQAGEAGKQII